MNPKILVTIPNIPPASPCAKFAIWVLERFRDSVSEEESISKLNEVLSQSVKPITKAGT
jgi:hypothetical protein